MVMRKRNDNSLHHVSFNGTSLHYLLLRQLFYAQILLSELYLFMNLGVLRWHGILGRLAANWSAALQVSAAIAGQRGNHV